MMVFVSMLKVVMVFYVLEWLGLEYCFIMWVWCDGDMLIFVGGGDLVLDIDVLLWLVDSMVVVWQGVVLMWFVIWGGVFLNVVWLLLVQDEYLLYNLIVFGMILNFNCVYLSWCLGVFLLEVWGEWQFLCVYMVIIGVVDWVWLLFIYDGSGKVECWMIVWGVMGLLGLCWLLVWWFEFYVGDVFQMLCCVKGLVLLQFEIVDQLSQGSQIVSL